MNTLHLLRHAKSSAKEDVEDHERRLSRRGREAARQLGKYLATKLGPIDVVLCSSARRNPRLGSLGVRDAAAQPDRGRAVSRFLRKIDSAAATAQVRRCQRIAHRT